MSEPRTISEALAAAERALVDYEVAKSQRLQPGDCCAAPQWRGHLCQYHQGYRDGIESMLERWGLVQSLLLGPGPATTATGGRQQDETGPGD